jgi:chromosome partitioning protein
MIITIAHTKGGVGKSTLAWQLAHSFHELDKTVRIVDLDFNQTLYFTRQLSDNPRIPVVQADGTEALRLQLHDANDATADIHIIDVGGFDSALNRDAIRMSDILLIPISDRVTDVLGYHTFHAILDDIGAAADVKLLLNNVHPLKRDFNAIRKALGDFDLLDSVVRTRKAYYETMGRGKSVFDIADMVPRSEIRSVRDELLQA